MFDECVVPECEFTHSFKQTSKTHKPICSNKNRRKQTDAERPTFSFHGTPAADESAARSRSFKATKNEEGEKNNHQAQTHSRDPNGLLD